MIPIEVAEYRRIRNRVMGVAASPKFDFARRLSDEIAALIDQHDEDGIAAADLIRDPEPSREAAVDLALRYIVPLRLHAHKRPVDQRALKWPKRLGWRYRVVESLSGGTGKGWRWDDAFDHPRSIAAKTSGFQKPAQALANRFISATAMDLSEAYEADRTASGYKRDSRSTETDTIMIATGAELPNFAKNASPERLLAHRRIAHAYRKHEEAAEAVRGEALVVKGPKAFASEDDEKEHGEIFKLKGINGKLITTTSLRSYIKDIASLPAFGEWEKAMLPSKAVAMARAVNGLGFDGITFTANLHATNYGRFGSAERETASAIQDQLYKVLKKRFGRPVDFYFVFEQGIQESPHIHGAVALAPDPDNMKAVRECLKQLADADAKRTAPERLVQVDPLFTAGRWGGYAVKALMVSTVRAGVENALSGTRAIRRRAKVEWELMRAEQRDAKKVFRESQTKE